MLRRHAFNQSHRTREHGNVAPEYAFNNFPYSRHCSPNTRLHIGIYRRRLFNTNINHKTGKLLIVFYVAMLHRMRVAVVFFFH